MDYSKLQNGSDVRGVAMAGVPGKEVNLTEDAVRNITRGFVRWLYEKVGKIPGKDPLKIMVGRDSRLSGPEIVHWVTTAAMKDGAFIADVGLASTPAMFMSTVLPGFQVDGAIMITASHLPWERNGMKFFTREGGLESADIRRILQIASWPMTDLPYLPDYSWHWNDLMAAYAAHLRRKIQDATGKEMPLEGLHIVVDAGNGAGGFYASKVLEPLGADISGSVLLEPDGRFPGHIPNPELPEAMACIQKAVLDSSADFGIIFDTDVDRAGAVLHDGRELNRNSLIAVLSAILLKENPGTTIVTDSITSTGLADFIAKKGGVHHRFRRGYRNVINEAIRLNEEGQDASLAIETSGHAAMKENYFLDDGAYVVTRLLIELAKGTKLEDLIADLKEPAEAKEFRFDILEEDFKACGGEILAALPDFANGMPGWEILKNNYEGVRVNADEAHGNGWFLLRLSLHDPILPLNIESDAEGGCRKIAA
ncbi:MAG: phosphomannomutase/phosphoglucomutase, partial [Lachnospiraceae bacterium]|nr:phosphomannomutase/phosphoglucomutase [Lachnospiraceae bacterium]